jgi:cytidine deaminase
MPEGQPTPSPVFDAEDAKLVTLARATRARTQALQGAAVRDTDGRTYAAASVELASLRLSALQVAVAMAVSSGAPGLEAAVVLSADPVDPDGVAAVADVAPKAPVHFVDLAGNPHS